MTSTSSSTFTGTATSDSYSYADDADLIALDQDLGNHDIPHEDDDDAEDSGHTAEESRLQKSLFSVWLTTRAEQTTARDFEKSLALTNGDEELSIHALMARTESTAIIGNPREYQLELFERAKTQNIIAVLDTGSGKTLIAVLLLRHVLEQEMEDRAKGMKHRVAFFLVDKVALCFQQFAVLEANLNHPIEKVYGNSGVSLWTRLEWQQMLAEKKIIVCTADVLDQALGKAFVTMEQINLLIFDEAHHTKKNHAYAKIIRNFYMTESANTRPRVFGMTASPIDAQEDVEEAASRLEALLHSTIATTLDSASLSRHSISRPNEERIVYDRLRTPYATLFALRMEKRFGDMDLFKRLFRNARETASDLGEWCADQLLARALSEHETLKYENKAGQNFYRSRHHGNVALLDNEIARIRAARTCVEEHTFKEPDQAENGISPKVTALHEYLYELYLRQPNSRTLIFVQKRHTAWLLAEIFKKIGNPSIQAGVLVGTGAGTPGESDTSIRRQMITIYQFRRGMLNLLISTSVAEEGLDIPDCNCVIRFDLYSTMIQYIQSRGRARHMSSKFVSMVELQNIDHECILEEVRHGESKMRQFCRNLPEDRLLKGNDYDLEQLFANEKGLPVYTESTTGAKITFHSALTTLEHFVSCLPREDEELSKADYVMSHDGRRFACEIIMPAQAPIRSINGRPFSSKAMAKRSAAFEMCVALRKGCYLNEDLMPIYHKQLPAMRNAQLALNIKATNSYTMRLKPQIWEVGRDTVPTELYLTIIGLEEMVVMDQKLIPLGFLTRTALIQFPPFPVFPKAEGRTNVISRSLQKSIPISSEVLAKLNTFTLRIYYDLFNKKFEEAPEKMSYWLAPLLPRAYDTIQSDPNLISTTVTSLIDWATLTFVHANPEIAWSPEMKAADLETKFLVDKWDGGKRYFTEKIMPEMRPNDPVPADSAPTKHMSSILEYSISLFSRSRQSAKYSWVEDQPVIRTRRVLHRRNWLDEWSQADKDAQTRAYICPEPLRISALPSSVAAMCYVFPAIVHRFEEYLTVQEASVQLGLVLQPSLTLEAMTKDSDNTDEHRLEQIQFQRGMGKNYERLEFIGDTFLKMATSIALYAANASDDEFESHVKRMLMICNKNLFNHAVACRLFENIRTKAFSRRTWYPEGLKLLEGKGKNVESKAMSRHRLNDKSIADVCEALIGAALLSPEDPNDMDMAVKAVTVMVQSADHSVASFAEYIGLYSPPQWQLEPATASQLDLAAQIARLDGYEFKNARLLRSAFTHPSHPFSLEHVPSYQRLEFLGDALLDMACVRWLYERHPHRDPQWLTEHKMAMVSNQFLGALCVQMGFHRHLKHNHTSLLGPITEYASAYREAAEGAEAEAKAELEQVIHKKNFAAQQTVNTDLTAKETTATVDPAEISTNSNEANNYGEPGRVKMDYWLQLPLPPKCLPDIVEAYTGALFVDSGFDYSRVVSFVTTHVAPFFEDIALYDDFAHAHPSAALYRLLSSPPLHCNKVRVMAGPLPTMNGWKVEHGIVFAAAAMVHQTMVATAEASSSRVAKARASANAVEKLRDMQRTEFVERFRCDCREGEEIENMGIAGGAENNGATEGKDLESVIAAAVQDGN